MAVTETAERVASVPADADVAPVGGLAGLLGTADHLVIGRLFLASSFVLLVVGRVAGILVDLERVDTDTVSVLDAAAAQVFSVHLVADTLLFLVPAFLGLAIALVPLQIGASTVAFPRAAAASFWAWLLSSGVLLASYLVDGGPAGAATDRDGALLWLVGLGGVATSLLLATVCLLTTALTLRTAGMGLDRVPMFTWGSVVAGLVWLLSLPVLVAAVVLGYVDVRYGADLGAEGLLAWAFGVPQVVAFALPALGVLLDVVPVAAGTPMRHRGVLMGAVAVAGLLGFGADLLATGTDAAIFQDALYVGASFALLLPLLAVAAGVGDALRRGRMRLNSPVLFAIGSLLLLLLAAALNAARVIDVLDLVGTSADSAVRELVVVAGLLGVGAGVHHWASKLFGTELSVGLAHIAAVVLLAGAVILGVPDFVSGLLDQPDGIVAGAVEDGVETLNAVALAGGVLVLVGVLLLVVNVLTGRVGDPTPDDPWDGHTLEWATSSPPVPGRPGPAEPVTSATPLLDTKGAQV